MILSLPAGNVRWVSFVPPRPIRQGHYAGLGPFVMAQEDPRQQVPRGDWGNHFVDPTKMVSHALV